MIITMQFQVLTTQFQVLENLREITNGTIGTIGAFFTRLIPSKESRSELSRLQNSISFAATSIFNFNRVENMKFSQMREETIGRLKSLSERFRNAKIADEVIAFHREEEVLLDSIDTTYSLACKQHKRDACDVYDELNLFDLSRF